MPEVSVIIPAYNAGRTIDAALDSVLRQTLSDIDVLVVDDGSTDDTASRVMSYGRRVSYVYQPHSGRPRAWNTGLLAARGRYVAFMDPTSVWMPRKLDRQWRYFDAFPQTGLVHTAAMDSPTPSAALLGSPDALPLDGPLPAPTPFESPALARTRIVTSSVMIRRELLDLAGLIDTSLPAADAEQDFWLRIAQRCAIGHLDLRMVVLRRPGDGEPARPATEVWRSNLLHDTAFRRARTSATRMVHRVDNAIGRRLRTSQRILFEAASPMSVAVFGPVLRHLRVDPRLEFWFTSCDRSWTPESIFAGANGRIVSPDDVRWMRFDGYINTDFWDMTWLRRCTRRVHFFHGVAGKYGLDAPVRIAPVVGTFDRLMFPNRDRLRRYIDAGLVDADSPQAALIGYPKVDCLVDGSLNREQTLERVGADPRRPTVLYAPTWSPYSSLNSMGHEVIAALGRLDVNVIVKLHDRSYDATARGSGGVNWRPLLRRVCERHGARLVHDADASPWLHAADLLITDHSSVGFEFMLLDRPIVVLDSPSLLTHARVSPDKAAMLRGAAHVVSDAGALGATVMHALACPREHAPQRKRIADELFFCPGSATARAVQSIYDLLELPQPAALGVDTHEPSMAKLQSIVRTV